jgi:signal peptidase I
VTLAGERSPERNLQMKLALSATGTPSRPELGETQDLYGPGPASPPGRIDRRPGAVAAATRRSRRRPDYRLRGLDLGVESLDDARTPPARKVGLHRRHRRRLVIKWIAILIMATVAAGLLRTYVVEPFSVPSAAMAPTLQVGDQILVVKPSFLAGPTTRGAVVVFSRPNRFPCRAGARESLDLVKRVVGLPGETIWSTGNTIHVDRHELNDRGWHDPALGQLASTPIHRTKIPHGEYFMLGDNRTDSCDSRSFGAVSGSSIVGEVKAVVLRHGHPYVHFLSSTP